MTSSGRSAADDSSVSTPTNNGGPRRVVWALSAAIVVALLVIAGLVGYLLADPGRSTSSPAASSPSFTSRSSQPSTGGVPELAPVARQFAREANAVPTNSTTYATKIKAVLQKYGEPACIAVITGYANAFGDFQPGQSSSDIRRITQAGTRGKVVTWDKAEHRYDSMYWNYADGRWQFTCDGMFDTAPSDEDSTQTPSTATAPAPSAALPGLN